MMGVRFSLLLSTCFYIGRIKYAPGTLASLFTFVIWAFFVPHDFVLRLAIILILTFIGYISTTKSLPVFKEKDPQAIVIDEVVGMSISLLFITEIALMLVAFILFRILDILKPSIIYYSQKFKGAHGIMLDDIIAGSCVLIILIMYI